MAVVTEGCLARKDIACQSCGESCPDQAIRFRPRIGSPFLPELNGGMCSGCGACLQVCPVGAITLRARAVEAADV
ncbi:4Fe-4S dicluster domain-containing protein [Rhizobium gallicum]|uniref:4Fe-4S dicluster domain-containing protein n=1 Tax=Rhizobium sp. SEMIA 4085 TaxID=2137761 RepID=UPI001CC22BF3|nr:4Fe-4S dicluster domain-containing protein [Rhizobium gallicum]